jgi:phosphatidylinositol alpha 1,6-mannosyltransferase
LPDAAFLGFRDGDELARLYASLDIFVHTGPAETFCQAVQEALASGLPVVAPDTGGPRDLVLPDRTGYLVGDDTALRDGVRRLLDPAVRARFGATGRRSVLRRTWTTVGDELIAHYGAVLDEFSVKCDVGVATPVPGSPRPHVA